MSKVHSFFSSWVEYWKGFGFNRSMRSKTVEHALHFIHYIKMSGAGLKQETISVETINFGGIWKVPGSGGMGH